MALVDRIEIESVWVNANIRMVNTDGVLTSAVLNGSGEDIPDEYELTLSNVAGGTATVTVVTSSPNNPSNGLVKNGVTLNGSAVYKDIIPGVDLVFAAGSANGEDALVAVGSFLGVFDATSVEAGVPSEGIRHQVKNEGTGAVSDAIATLMTQAIQKKKTGTVFEYIRPVADGATGKVAGGGSNRIMPYALKVVNVSGAGINKTADLQVDNVTLGADSILDLTNSEEVSGTGLKAISPGHPYRIISGPLTGLEFALSSVCANDDIANVLIFPSQFVQLAPDEDGEPGEYSAIADVPLTEEGQAEGVIQPNGLAYYWVRVLVPVGGNAESNPYPLNVVLEASESGSAGWSV